MIDRIVDTGAARWLKVWMPVLKRTFFFSPSSPLLEVEAVVKPGRPAK
jgi:hypothetical protein